MNFAWTRRVVPPWRRSSDPLVKFSDKQQFGPQELIPEVISDSFENELAKFSEVPSLGLAADLLRFGRHLVLADALAPAARLVLATSTRIPVALKGLARAVLQRKLEGFDLAPITDTTKSNALQVNQIRAWLRKYPNDSLSWLDLGRLQASLGSTEAARRSVQTALGLSPENRMVLRSSSRFYLHAHEPERAFSILDKSSRTPSDPWLLAGHISISSILEKTSRFAKKSKSIVAQRIHRPSDETELSSALATLELDSGNTREAKRLFAQSLIAPNDNSLAQMEWAMQQLNIVPNLPAEWLKNPASSEANYYRSVLDTNFPGALNAAIQWHQNEPFASRPMVGASFVAGVMGQFSEAQNFARQGLFLEPQNLQLLNNLVFSTGAQGKIDEAEALLKKVIAIEKGDASPHTFANMGMICYLRGEFVLGDRFYDAAVRLARQRRDLEEASMADSFRARFSMMASDPNYNGKLQAARQAAESSKSALAAAVFQAVTKEQAADMSVPRKVAGPRNWRYDRDRNTLIFDSKKPLG